MWDSLESIYESAEKDSDCEAYVMQITYYDKEENERLTKLQDESNLYSASLVLFHGRNILWMKLIWISYSSTIRMMMEI